MVDDESVLEINATNAETLLLGEDERFVSASLIFVFVCGKSGHLHGAVIWMRMRLWVTSCGGSAGTCVEELMPIDRGALVSQSDRACCSRKWHICPCDIATAGTVVQIAVGSVVHLGRCLVAVIDPVTHDAGHDSFVMGLSFVPPEHHPRHHSLASYEHRRSCAGPTIQPHACATKRRRLLLVRRQSMSPSYSTEKPMVRAARRAHGLRTGRPPPAAWSSSGRAIVVRGPGQGRMGRTDGQRPLRCVWRMYPDRHASLHCVHQPAPTSKLKPALRSHVHHTLDSLTSSLLHFIVTPRRVPVTSLFICGAFSFAKLAHAVQQSS